MKDLSEKISNLKNWHIFLILFLLGWLAYINVLNGEFIWDETALIVKNEYTHSFKYFAKWFTDDSIAGSGLTHGNLYRPFSTVIYAAVYAVFGLNTIPYHVANILLHITNAFFVYLLLQKFDFKKFGSLLAAAIFLLHPVQTESVSYIAGLPDVLSPFFVLLGILLLLGKPRPITLAIILILAILSKETGIIFVPLAAIALYFKKDNFTKTEMNSKIKTLIILSTITLTYILLRSTILNFSGTFSLSFAESVYSQNALFRVYTFFAVLVEYAILIFYPANLYFEKALEIYAYISPQVAVGILIAAITTIMAVISYHKRRHFLFAYAWFIVSIVLVSGVLIPSNATYKEHWLYMPLIGIAFLIASIWEGLKNNRQQKTFKAAVAILLIIFVSQVINRNREWKSVETFFKNEIEHYDGSSRVHEQFGRYYFEKKNYETAIEHFQRGIEADKGNFVPSLRINLGHAYLAIKNLDAAVNEYFTVLESYPENLDAHVALYNIAIATRSEKMEKAFLGFLQRIESGGTVNFENEILPFATVND